MYFSISAVWIWDKSTFFSKLIANSTSSARFCASISSFDKCVFSISNASSKSSIFHFVCSLPWSAINVASSAVLRRSFHNSLLIYRTGQSLLWNNISSKGWHFQNCWRTLILNICFLSKDLCEKCLVLFVMLVRHGIIGLCGSADFLISIIWIFWCLCMSKTSL